MTFRHVKRAAIPVLAAVLLASAAQGAGANRLSSTNSLFRIVWSELRFQGSLGIELVCPVTLDGSFHGRTMTKTVGLLIGYITRASVTASGCVGGTASFLNGSENTLNTLPWHVTYASFTGALPAITGIGIRINGLSVRLRDTTGFGFLDCLYSSTAERPAGATFARETTRGVITGLNPVFEEALAIPLHGTNAGTCPASILWGGANTTGRVTVLGSAEAIDFSLI